MNKTYQGNVSVYSNRNNKVVLHGDPDGQYNQGNVDELVKVMVDVAHANKMQFIPFIPKQYNGDTKGLSPVILANKWDGKPYIAYLPKREGTVNKAPIKLA